MTQMMQVTQTSPGALSLKIISLKWVQSGMGQIGKEILRHLRHLRHSTRLFKKIAVTHRVTHRTHVTHLIQVTQPASLLTH
jgi:hypothetical protein